MNYLLQQGIIDNMQYKELLSTINFVYRSDCKKFEGNVTFRYTKDKSILQNMDIYIPSCGRPALVAKM